MLSMIRKWLRALIGWEDMDAAIKAQSNYLKSLEALITAQGEEIAMLRRLRMYREEVKHPTLTQDWERVQAEYAANPENFKEN